MSSGRPAPPKPWEKAKATGAAPVDSSPAAGAAKPWEKPPGEVAGAVSTANTPARPWESGAASTYGAAGYSGVGGPGSSMYGSGLRGYGNNLYGGSSMYGGSMYGGGLGGYGMQSRYGMGGMGGYGSSLYGSSLYGGMGGMYGGGMGGGMYGGMGGMGGGYMTPGLGPPGAPGMVGDPNDPNGPPAPTPRWQMLLQSLHGIMTLFGRISFLVDENTQAVHFFITAILQLLDRSGMLYAELARFVLRLLGYKPKQQNPALPPGAEAGKMVPPGVGEQAWGQGVQNVAWGNGAPNSVQSFNNAWGPRQGLP